MVEKYLISFAGGLVGWVLGILVAVISAVLGNPIPSDELIPYILVGVCIIVVMVDTMIPLEIKFGAENSRTALFAVMAAIVIAIVVITKILPASVVAGVVGFLAGLSELQLVLGILLVCTALTVISVALSFAFIKKKEF